MKSDPAQAFYDYVPLMFEHHDAGTQSDAADAITDKMDGPWYGMNDEGRRLASRMAVLLNAWEDAKLIMEGKGKIDAAKWLTYYGTLKRDP